MLHFLTLILYLFHKLLTLYKKLYIFLSFSLHFFHFFSLKYSCFLEYISLKIFNLNKKEILLSYSFDFY